MSKEEQLSQLHEDIWDKYGEWLEMAESPSYVLIHILSNLVIKERELNEYYRRRLDHGCSCANSTN